MKDYLAQLLAASPSALDRRLLAREYLQARLLELLQVQGAFNRGAFLGGTALRFLFGLGRFSEDLDFSTLVPDAGFPLEEMASRCRRRLAASQPRVAEQRSQADFLGRTAAGPGQLARCSGRTARGHRLERGGPGRAPVSRTSG